MEIYFTNIPDVGDLSLEHVFYEYEEPVLFVCTDASGKRYLCSCCRLSENWIVRQVDEALLVDMIDNRVSLDNMFRFPDNKTLFLSWNGETMRYSFDVPEKAFPQSGSYLELSKDKTDSYRSFLKTRTGTSRLIENETRLGGSYSFVPAENRMIYVAGTGFNLNDHIFPDSMSEFSTLPAVSEQDTGYFQYLVDCSGKNHQYKPLIFTFGNEMVETTVVSTKLSDEVQDVNCEDSWLSAA